MPSISYLAKRLCTMNYKAMFDRVNVVKTKCDKSKVFIFFDMVWCGLRYGAGYVDYDVIGFYKLNSKQRKTMLTRGINNKFVKKFNEKEYWHLFNNKNEFNECFRDYLKRDFVYPVDEDKEKTIEWMKAHSVFFAKPNDGQCGKNIEKIDIKTWNNRFDKVEDDKSVDNKNNSNGEVINNEITDEAEKLNDLYDYLVFNKLKLLEEPVIQCDEMNKLNPSSVNTTRMVSIMNDVGEVTILATFVRIGNGKVVDNFNSGGMTAKVDVETGVILEEAVNKAGELFEKHPITGTTIKGFKMPYWDEAKEMVKSAAKKSPHVRYVGWDVGMSVNGPVLIEGNQFPGHDIYQVAEKMKEGELGILPLFEEAMKTKL